MKNLLSKLTWLMTDWRKNEQDVELAEDVAVFQSETGQAAHKNTLATICQQDREKFDAWFYGRPERLENFNSTMNHIYTLLRTPKNS